MTPQELKNSILQLAIQGKLVEQRPEEGTAEELYQQIQAEKQRLIKECKIKKEKPLPEVTEDELPFDIPESWKWVRWGEVINIVSARRVHQSDWKSEGIPFYRAREIAKLAEDGYVNNELYISQELYNEFSKSGVPQPGDLMVTAVGTLGKTYIVKPDDRFYYKDASVICFENYGNILSEYLRLVMHSKMMMNQIRSNSSGTTVATLTMVRMAEYLLPLPPLAEQKRIVEKIEELIPYIERYERAWSKLEELNKRFPIDLEKSILEMAIQGKLVEQRPEEGTGEELYQQIQDEKQRLIKEGKIKKEKPLPEITEDEIPFDIPENWKWALFGELGNYKKGPFGSALTKDMFVPKGNGAVKVYEQKNAIQKNASIGDYYITREYFETKMSSFEVHPGDVIVSCAGTIGEAFVLPDNIEQGIINQALMRMRLFKPIYVPYFLMYFDVVLKQNARSGSKGSAIKNIPPFDVLKRYPVPLPPLAEQKRIVDKLEKILPLCEKLKK
jgi:type I restriction enzyme S subunit